MKKNKETGKKREKDIMNGTNEDGIKKVRNIIPV
jgi:hypothetical protein